MKKISICSCLFSISLILLVSCRNDENFETENTTYNNLSEKNTKKISAESFIDHSKESNKIDSLNSEAESLDTTSPNEEQDPKGIPPKK